MSKAKLIKKDSPMQEQLLQRKKKRKQRVAQPMVARKAFELTAEWLKTKQNSTSNARESFAALFVDADPQSI